MKEVVREKATMETDKDGHSNLGGKECGVWRGKDAGFKKEETAAYFHEEKKS